MTSHHTPCKWEKEIGAEFWHNDWHKSPEVNSHKGSKLEEMHQRQMLIVKLTFDRPTRCTGTGFYVNIPEVKPGWYTCDGDGSASARGQNLENTKQRYDIILTAGHNLIGDDGQMSKNIHVERVTIVAENGNLVYNKDDIPVSESQVMISEKYRQNPGTYNSHNDWRVILVEANDGMHGFGINLPFGLDNKEGENESLIQQALKSHQVTIAGYQPQGPIKSTSGPGRVGRAGEIEYEAQTEPGISGSPVWLPYQGLDTVIAIHRGSRIRFELLEQLYRRTNLGYFSKSLKATQAERVGNIVDYAKGIYLRFPGPGGRAKVRLGAEGLQTTFDVLPVLTEPAKTNESNTGDRVHYVFRMHGAEEGGESRSHQWVLWNIDLNKVSLVQNIHPACLVKLLDGRKLAESFQVVYTGGQNLNNRDYYALTVETKRLRIEDEDMGIPTETSEVSLHKVNARRDLLSIIISDLKPVDQYYESVAI
ncbi:hypothetical protein TARUN_1561 [Trichoderma arundinaceum]|uniref:Serine protease n=1 Tax=Trichoderma arundinaceum TaxID=490622 RepID=A0A395NWX9_TRIAR|nr:hypothetical protein TARUN_1561 [Trichoderma arundinaceum]